MISFYLRDPDTVSHRAIKVKKVLAFNREFTIKTLVDDRYPESKFVTEFFKTFQPEKPKDEIKDLFKSKVDVFVDAYKKGDSIAIDGYNNIDFEKKHVDLLIKLLSEEASTPNQQIIQEHLIDELADFKSDRVQKFLDDLYKRSFRNSYSQLAILRSLAGEEDKKINEAIDELIKDRCSYL